MAAAAAAAASVEAAETEAAAAETEAAAAETEAAAAERQQQQPPAHPFRVRTITAFLELPPSPELWEAEVEAAGAFLGRAQAALEQKGYEVQTTRVATQPFPLFLRGGGSSGGGGGGSPADQLVRNAVRLEALAAKHGVRLLSIGSSDAQDLEAIPELLAATTNMSCSFRMPPDTDVALARRAAGATMRLAALTGGLGNFRFAAACRVPPGVPYFPVAAAGPGLHRTFAIGTESDALLHEAFAAAAAAHEGAGGRGTLQAAERALAATLQRHLAPLEAAALEIEAAEAAAAAPGPTQQQQQQQQQQQLEPGSGGDGSGCGDATAAAGPFTFLGLDTSLAPGLDTPPLTASYELLGCCHAFGGPGTLAASSLITRVLRSLPLRTTGYCGLMLAVCEDTGLAAAAAAGSVTISSLLQYSAVCGCGLDTVPVPGPALPSKQGAGGCAAAAAAAAADEETTACIASLLCDVSALAHRLAKPLACRLLPLPGRAAGDPTGFDHPYMVNSAVMDLRR